MPEAPVQNFSNHTRLLPIYHFFALPVTLLYALYQIYEAARNPTTASIVWAVYASAIACAVLASRFMAVSVQDRVIRLEETLRMQRILPASMQGDIAKLTRRQFVALRFASDDELADLVRRTVAGEFQTQKEIKQAVKNWRADWLRA
ncbi:MAG TPA: DUF6526 family protein [Gemmatimonadaceae bacterium]|nr:DUF6526 family protein [Gemmatimonadaceae bacterium]